MLTGDHRQNHPIPLLTSSPRGANHLAPALALALTLILTLTKALKLALEVALKLVLTLALTLNRRRSRIALFHGMS